MLGQGASLPGVDRQRPGPAARDRAGVHSALVGAGSAEGVVPGSPLAVPAGLVGRVVTVGRGVSRAQLLLDASAAAGARIARTGELGVVRGDGRGALTLNNIATTSSVARGDLIESAGIDGIYPRGVPIGRVESVARGSKLFLEIRVAPTADFSRLTDVLLLAPSPAVRESAGADAGPKGARPMKIGRIALLLGGRSRARILRGPARAYRGFLARGLVPARDGGGGPQRRLRARGARRGPRPALSRTPSAAAALGMNAFAKAILGYALTLVSVRVVFGGAWRGRGGAGRRVARQRSDRRPALRAAVRSRRSSSSRARRSGAPSRRAWPGARSRRRGTFRGASGGSGGAAEAAVTRSPPEADVLRIREDRQALVRRIEVSRVAVGTVLSLLAVAYWTVQIVRGEYYFTLSENNRIRAVKITAPRGLRAGPQRRDLVENEPAYTLHLYRREAKDLERLGRFHRGPARPQHASAWLRAWSGAARTRSSCRSRSPRTSAIEEVAAVEARAAEHPGVRDHGLAAAPVQARRLRRPRARLPLRGDARADQERRQRLRRRRLDRAEGRSRAPTSGCWPASNGERRVIVDSHGREVAEEARLEASPGQNLFLTLDLKLQDVAEEYFKDKVGSVVALDPRDGRDPRAGLVALLRSELVHAARDVRGVERPAREPRPSAPEPGDPEHVFARARSSSRSSPTARWRAGPRGPGARRSSAPATPSSTAASSTATRRAATAWSTCATRSRCRATSTSTTWAGSSASTGSPRSLTLVRLRQPDGRGPLRSRSRGSCRRRSGRASSGEARGGTRARRSRSSIGQGPLLVTPMQVARALSGLVERGPPADAAPLLLLAGPEARARSCATRPSSHDAIAARARKARDRQGRDVGGRQRAGRHGLRLARRRASRWAARRAPRRWSARRRPSGPAPTSPSSQDHAWFVGFGPVEDPQMVVVVFVENGGHGNLAAAPLAKALFEARFGVAPKPPRSGRRRPRRPSAPGIARAARPVTP